MNADELLAGIRDGNFHCGGIRCLRLFDVERNFARALRDEADRLCATEPSSDVQEREHVTNWTRPHGAVRQFSLLNRSGDFADFGGDHDLSCRGKRFHHAPQYPHLARFVGCFGHAVNFRLNVLGAGAGLAPHEEHSLFVSEAGLPAVRARFHLPLRTSRDARMTIDGEVCRFAPRTIYYFNQGCVHAAANQGPAERIHLVWDMLLTAQTFALMFGDAAPPPQLRHVAANARAVRILAKTRVHHYARMAPDVTPLEADRVKLCLAQ